MRFLKILVIASFVLLVSSCGKCKKCKGYNDHIIILNGIITSFDVQISGNVFIGEDTIGTQAIWARGPEGHAEIINRGVEDGHWNIFFEDCMRDGCMDIDLFILVDDLDRIQDITVSENARVYSDDVRLDVERMHFDLNSSGSIDFPNLRADSLIVSLSGSGNINIDGSGSNLKVNHSGSGDVQLFDFPVSNANVNSSGAGSSFVKASSQLNIDLSGSGNVHYLGAADTTINNTGTGQVIDEN